MIATRGKVTLQQPEFTLNKTKVFNKTIHTEIINANSNVDKFHYHADYEIMFSLGAFGKSFLGDEVREFNENDLIIVGPNLPHLWQIFPSKKYHFVTAEIICIQFNESFLSTNFCDLPEMLMVKKLLKDALRGVILKFKSPEKIREKVLSLIAKSGWNRLIALIDLICFLGETHYNLAVSKSFSRSSYTTSSGNKIDHIVNFLSENHHRNLTLKQVAEQACMNASAFCRYFKKASGKTYSEYLNQIRINTACDKLLGTTLSISEIGYQCGYHNISYFNRQFKIVKNISPSDYRTNYSYSEQMHLKAS